MIAGLFVVTGKDYVELCKQIGDNAEAERAQKCIDSMVEAVKKHGWDGEWYLLDNVRVLIGGDGRDGIPSHIAPKLQSEPGVYNDTILAGLDFLMAAYCCGVCDS